LKSALGISQQNKNLDIKLIVSIFVALVFSTQLLMAECAPDRAQFKMGSSSAVFDVEIADTYDARAKGLMFRKSLARFSGMLFFYDEPQSVSFWMENTLIPLDMIFMDHTGLVVNIHSNAVPLDRTAIFGGNDIFAVLEINGGLGKALGVQIGASMQHPAFDQKIAVWPCKN
jgi:uncharacterized membrane protein (UPF0127 family)